MNEEKILEKIRKSAETIQVPEELKPESVEARLSASRAPAGRSSFRSFAAAAAAFVLCAGVWGAAGHISSAQNGTAAQITAETTQPEEASATAEQTDDAAISPAGLAGLAPIQDYRELYDALRELQITQNVAFAAEKSTDMGEAQAIAEDTAAATNSAMAAAGSYSSTNTQVEGIDEGDIVKTDGAFLYILRQSQEVTIVSADTMEVAGNLSLPNYNDYIEDMYVTDHRLILIAGSTSSDLIESGDAAYRVRSRDTVTAYTYDVQDPADAKLLGQVSQDGCYRSSRLGGEYLYLFTDYAPGIPEDPTPLEEYVPIVGSRTVEEDNIFIPEIRSSSNSLVISSIDLREPDKSQDCKSILSGADNFYVSEDHIFITNTRWDSTDTTQIISFAYSGGKITPQAAGSIRGYLNDQFSLDEYQGHLRAVATCTSSQAAEEYNCLYVLDEDLNITGKIDDLSPGETIRSARFFGDTGYFVTYRNMDPLFSVDLSDPEKPSILGKLKITGFSEYLHFYDDDLLLGIGWETDPDSGETLGMKLSMFDISDPANVTEKDKFVIKDIYDCPATNDHRTVMIDPEKNLFGLAYAGNGSGRTDSSYSLFSYDRNQGFIEQFTCSLNEGTNQYGYTDIWNARGIYIGDDFYLSTENSLIKFDMKNDFAAMGKLTWQDVKYVP